MCEDLQFEVSDMDIPLFLVRLGCSCITLYHRVFSWQLMHFVR